MNIQSVDTSKPYPFLRAFVRPAAIWPIYRMQHGQEVRGISIGGGIRFFWN